MNSHLRRVVCAAAFTFVIGPAFGVDTAPAAGDTDKLAKVRVLVAEKKWSAAVDELKRVNDPASADWNNLMGYNLRKRATPDLAAAEGFYNEALRIDPKHRGALSYSGELYLMKGDLAMAQERLSTLDKVCVLSCDEYTTLKKAVQRYQANGNQYVAVP